jgi:phenylalanyl-tRNA synthetase beta chain
MLISRNILKSFFSQVLPDSLVISRELTMKSFEVEGIEEVDDDTIYSIDILPNRGSDCLSHLGVAREVSVIFNLPIDSFNNSVDLLEEVNPHNLKITFELGTTSRFVAILLSGLDNKKQSPEWLKDALRALGERPISLIVDITNYVMLVTGQPLHAYDADKLELITKKPLSLHVGFSKAGDTLQTLDGETHELQGNELLINSAPEGKPLGFAGIKGGMATAVDESTSRIVLEAASFNTGIIRKSARFAKIHTTASKRFENEILPELQVIGIRTALELLQGLCDGLVVEALRDEYPKKREPAEIELPYSAAANLLGIDISKEVQIETLTQLGALITEKTDGLKVVPPWYRPDLKLSVDLIEELGRLVGYEKIKAKPLLKKTASLDGALKLNELLRDFLIERGFDEIITRSFAKTGEVELENPLAKNTPFLRKNLLENIKNSLSLNAQNAELLELECIKVFEIGTVFTKDIEETHLAIGIQKTKNSRTKSLLSEEIEKLEKGIIKYTAGNVELSKNKSETLEESGSIIVEYNLSEYKLASTDSYALPENQINDFKHFRAFSVFPYVLRDVAIWTPSGTTADAVEEIIRRNLGPELQIVTLFDRFEKEFDGIQRTSFAFRLVFQSFTKTLSDEEINQQMEALNKVILETEGFEMR